MKRSRKERCGLARAFAKEGAHVVDDVKQILATVPLGRFCDPEKDIGRVAVFLASADADCLTGQTLCVDGGLVML